MAKEKGPVSLSKIDQRTWQRFQAACKLKHKSTHRVTEALWTEYTYRVFAEELQDKPKQWEEEKKEKEAN